MNWPPDVSPRSGPELPPPAQFGPPVPQISTNVPSLIEPDEMPVSWSSASAAVDVIEESATSGFGFVLNPKGRHFGLRLQRAVRRVGQRIGEDVVARPVHAIEGEGERRRKPRNDRSVRESVEEDGDDVTRIIARAVVRHDCRRRRDSARQRQACQCGLQCEFHFQSPVVMPGTRPRFEERIV